MYRNAFVRRKSRGSLDPLGHLTNQVEKELVRAEQGRLRANPHGLPFSAIFPYDAPPLRLRGVDLSDLLRQS
jgi:hypothetical protein